MYRRIGQLEQKLVEQQDAFTKKLDTLNQFVNELKSIKTLPMEEKIGSIQNTLQSLEKLMHI